jgi:hypothetical protein
MFVNCAAPLLSVTVLFSYPVTLFAMVTVAPATAAPDGSFTEITTVPELPDACGGGVPAESP